MKTTVRISAMNGQTETVKAFATEQKAKQFFAEWCDEHGYNYEEGATEAGGIGHDYRIELI